MERSAGVLRVETYRSPIDDAEILPKQRFAARQKPVSIWVEVERNLLVGSAAEPSGGSIAVVRSEFPHVRLSRDG
jgi:hypothetical protein